jgi:hypothetical protein
LLLQLERWSRDETATKKPRKGRQQQDQQQEQPPPPFQYSLQLLVPPGQLELGRRLITTMYSSSPDLSDLNAPQLMQLVTLAECYSVGKVVADAAAQLNKLGVETIDIAAAVFKLPEACLQLAAMRKVQQAAADRLQQELGDLEKVWADEDKQPQLLGLPSAALLQLLRDERTRVASEDTAVYTAQAWLDRRFGGVRMIVPGRPDPKQQQQQQLASVLRPPHCTATFLALLAANSSDWGWVYNHEPRLLVDLVASIGRSGPERELWAAAIPEDKVAWRLLPRPVSAVTQLELSWYLPLSDIEEELAVDPKDIVSLGSCDNQVIWQGRNWQPNVEYDPGSEFMDAFVMVRGAPAYTTGVIDLQPVLNTAGSDYRVSLEGDYVRGGRGGAVAEWGPGKEEWPQVKAWLQQQGLVHPDGCLHLRSTITSVT